MIFRKLTQNNYLSRSLVILDGKSMVIEVTD